MVVNSVFYQKLSFVALIRYNPSGVLSHWNNSTLFLHVEKKLPVLQKPGILYKLNITILNIVVTGP